MKTKVESDKNTLKRGPPSVTDRLDAESRRIAKLSHELVYVYGVYGVLDGFTKASGLIKYCFDLLYTDSNCSSSDKMHDWMLTPAGIAVAATETITLVAFSLLGNVLKDNDEDAFKRYIAILWPYFRDTLQGLKNAYTGVRAGLQAFGVLSGQNTRYMIVPFGVLLGSLSVLNRIAMRKYVTEPRKAMTSANGETLQEILRTTLSDKAAYDVFRIGYKLSLMPQDSNIEINTLYLEVVNGLLQYTVISPSGEKICAQIDKKILKYDLTNPVTLDQLKPLLPDILKITSKRSHTFGTVGIGRQSDSLSRNALLGAAYGGVVDGLYLYMGAIGLAVLSYNVFMMVAICCTVFSLTCIATRIYEEKAYQRKFIATQAKIELALCGKELELIFVEIQALAVLASIPVSDEHSETQQQEQSKQQALLMTEFEEKIKEFEVKREKLRVQLTLTDKMAALAGLRDGLAAYSAIGSAMFAVATFKAMLFAPFPPAFLIACVSAGMVSLIGFLAYSLIKNHVHVNASNKKGNAPPEGSFGFYLTEFKRNKEVIRHLEPEKVKNAIIEGMVVDRSPQFHFQEWFEVVRSFCSGLGKGQKSVDFALYPLQEADLQGHYHDTPIMFTVMLLSTAFHSVALALRAHARGFGRPDLEDVKPNATHADSIAVHERSLTSRAPNPADEKRMRLSLLRPHMVGESDDGSCSIAASPVPPRPSTSSAIYNPSFFPTAKMRPRALSVDSLSDRIRKFPRSSPDTTPDSESSRCTS